MTTAYFFDNQGRPITNADEQHLAESCRYTLETAHTGRQERAAILRDLRARILAFYGDAEKLKYAADLDAHLGHYYAPALTISRALEEITRELDRIEGPLADTLFPGWKVLDRDGFFNHLHEAQSDGFLYYQEGGKIILKEERHNVSAVAFFQFWKGEGFIDCDHEPWAALCENVLYQDKKGTLKPLKNKVLGNIYSERKYKNQLAEIEEAFK